MSADLEFTMTGAILTGKADAVMRLATLDVEKAIADQGQVQVTAELRRVIRNPTPYYEKQIRSKRTGEFYKVTDTGVIYGPWLEGTSSRNNTTRFRGYATFRRETAQIQLMAPRIASGVLQRYVVRL